MQPAHHKTNNKADPPIESLWRSAADYYLNLEPLGGLYNTNETCICSSDDYSLNTICTAHDESRPETIDRMTTTMTDKLWLDELALMEAQAETNEVDALDDSKSSHDQDIARDNNG